MLHFLNVMRSPGRNKKFPLMNNFEIKIFGASKSYQMAVDRVLIRVGFMDVYKFCEIGVENLTKSSFLRDGNLRSSIRFSIREKLESFV